MKTFFLFEPGNYFVFLFSLKSLRLHGLGFSPSSQCLEVQGDHNLAKDSPVPKIKQLLARSELPHWHCWKSTFRAQVQTSCWPWVEHSPVGRADSLSSCRLSPRTPLPAPKIFWDCHLRLSHVDKFKVHSGTWARNSNKTHILLSRTFSQPLG